MKKGEYIKSGAWRVNQAAIKKSEERKKRIYPKRAGSVYDSGEIG
ncbi:hypothetical protein ACFQ88_37740 [Paenibacillus sp. NPDC056579]|nr:hypothetical protein [Paenibacillus sp. H1-7]